MAKKRKTRQEKVIADLRRQLATQPLPQSSLGNSYSFSEVKPIIPPNTFNLKPHTYAYVLSDLRKTLILTSIAIASQIILYFVLMR